MAETSSGKRPTQRMEGFTMSKVITLTDEQYRTVERAAARGQTPETLLAEVIEELRDPHGEPRYYETDDRLRHLGMSEERIRRANARHQEHELDASLSTQPPMEPV